MVFTPVLTQHQSKLSAESVETKVFIYIRVRLNYYVIWTTDHLIEKNVIGRLTWQLQGKAERMRRITTFVDLLQVIWDIPNQVFTVFASCSQL